MSRIQLRSVGGSPFLAILSVILGIALTACGTTDNQVTCKKTINGHHELCVQNHIVYAPIYVYRAARVGGSYDPVTRVYTPVEEPHVVDPHIVEVPHVSVGVK